MSRISRRECHLLDLEYEGLDEFVEEVKSFINKEKIPEGYSIEVYKDFIGCCGFFPIGVAFEIDGPEDQTIKDLDLKVYSRIIEICERKRIENHECRPLEII